jgi:histidine ammonia-lyase
MGADSSLLTMKALDDAYILTAIELITLAQATDVLKVRRRLSGPSRELHDSVREYFKTIKNDRALNGELEAVIQFARSHKDIPLTWHVSSRKRLFS